MTGCPVRRGGWRAHGDALPQHQEQHRPQHEHDDRNPEVYVCDDGVDAGTRHISLLVIDGRSFGRNFRWRTMPVGDELAAASALLGGVQHSSATRDHASRSDSRAATCQARRRRHRAAGRLQQHASRVNEVPVVVCHEVRRARSSYPNRESREDPARCATLRCGPRDGAPGFHGAAVGTDHGGLPDGPPLDVEPLEPYRGGNADRRPVHEAEAVDRVVPGRQRAVLVVLAHGARLPLAAPDQLLRPGTEISTVSRSSAITGPTATSSSFHQSPQLRTRHSEEREPLQKPEPGPTVERRMHQSVTRVSVTFEHPPPTSSATKATASAAAAGRRRRGQRKRNLT